MEEKQNQLTEVDLKLISQLVYLDIKSYHGVPTDLYNTYKNNGNKITVGQLIDYYKSEEGQQQLKQKYPPAKILNEVPEYELWNSMLNSIDNSKYRSWEISNLVANNQPEESGFVAITVDTQNGAKVAAFRGSEEITDPFFKNDWKNNGTTAYELESVQQAEAAAYMKKFGLDDESDLYLTGHSLGGNLALYASFVLSDEQRRRLISASTFNAPGFNRALLDKFRGVIDAMNAKGQLLEYRNKHDLVPALFMNPSPGIYIDSLSKELTGFSHHSLFSFAQDDASTFHRSETQMRAVIPNMVHHITVGLEVVPGFLKEALVTEVFKIWDGDIEWYHILFAAAAVAAVFIAGPVAVLVGALKVVLALYVIGFIIDKVIPWIEKGVARLAELVETFFNEAADFITGLVFQAIDAAKLIGSKAAEFGRQVKGAVSKFFSDLKEGFKRFVADTIQFVEAQKERFIKLKDQVARKLGDIFNSVKSTIKRKKDELVDGVKTFKNKLVGGLKSAIKTVARYAVSAAGAVKAAQIQASLQRVEALHRLLRNKEEQLSDVIARILNVASGVSSSVGGAYPESYVQSALRELQEAREDVRAKERRVGDSLKQQSDGVRYSVETYRSTEARLSGLARA